MPLPFPKLHEKCKTHVCLIDHERGDERWEDVFGMRREEKDTACREDFEELRQRYHAESDAARLNTLGGYIGLYKLKTSRFGAERRKCTIDHRGIFVVTDDQASNIITSFRPIGDNNPPPKTDGEFKRDALSYYKKLTKKDWGT